MWRDGFEAVRTHAKGLGMTVAKKPKRKAGGKPFPKGMPGGPGRGHKKPALEWGPDAAADMRLAYSTPQTPGESPGVTSARRLLASNYERFVTILARLSPPPVASDATPTVLQPAPHAPGPKEERVGEMIRAMLDEFGAKYGDQLEGDRGQATPTADGTTTRTVA